MSGAGGVLLVDKPEGPTSHDVVSWVRRTLEERRVGHTGTLDPFASGLLVLCVGGATRLSEYLTGLDKEYLAVVRLGQRTRTDDPEGEVVEESEGWAELGARDVEDALGALRGDTFQIPPRFSAKKVAGEPAHRRVRRGERVELAPVRVRVHALELAELDLPCLRLRVQCSSGTYVRALARDLGEALGVGAHLSALRRTRVGPFRVEDAVADSALHDRQAMRGALMEPSAGLAHFPRVEVSADEARRLSQGQVIPIPPGAATADGPVAVLEAGVLVAVASAEGLHLRPRKVFAR